jgi:hypothetical protein
VRNIRNDGRVRLRYGRTTRECTTREVAAAEAGPVLKRYVTIATKTRAQFRATRDSPVGDFVAQADRHPVFRAHPARRRCTNCRHPALTREQRATPARPTTLRTRRRNPSPTPAGVLRTNMAPAHPSERSNRAAQTTAMASGASRRFP